VTTATDIPRRALRDPVWYYEEILGVTYIYDKQREILEALTQYDKVAVLGCNGSGKDWTSGRAILWWLGTHYPAKVVVIGPTHRQVSDIVFRESRNGYQQAHYPLGGRFLQQTSRYNIDNESFAIGFATNDAFNILGYHSPATLVIVTEAHNVDQDHIDAIMRLQPKCILMTGNAFALSGAFFDAFNENRENWHTIRIAASDTPNVIEGREVVPGMITQEWVADRAEGWGIDSPEYIASVLAQFPDTLEDTLVARSDIMKAVELKIKPDRDETVILSCDVARYGQDHTVVYRRKGHRCRKILDVQGHDTQQVAGELGRLAEAVGACKEHREGSFAQARVDCARCNMVDVEIIVDETGLGAGVLDRLKEQELRSGNCSVYGFNGGEKADDNERYVNAVTEAWLELAKAIKAGMVDLDNNTNIISQLSSRRYKIQGDRRLALETKDDYKKRVKRSPDDADALAMAYSPLCGAPSFNYFDA